ncbi:MAG TPA: hypothetical protein VNJ70_17935 [Thermoanaerobaculia bacterium]|nr:hypothetical protein [Thermoanaerobaculia bacterium]
MVQGDVETNRVSASLNTGAALDSLFDTRTPARVLLARNSPRLARPEYCAALLASSWALRYEDPEESALQSECAFAIAQRVGEPPLLSRASADLGNARRRFGRWSEAARLFVAAARLVPGDAAALARIESFRAALYSARRQWPAAHAAVGRSAILYERAGDHWGRRAAVIQCGICYVEQGEPERAIPLLFTTANALAGTPERDLLRFALQPLLWALVDAGEAKRAHRWYRMALPVFAGGGAHYRLKVSWLLGRILAAEGAHAEAAAELETVRLRCAEAGLIQEAALAGLDLAVAHAELLDRAALRRVLLEIRPLLRALRCSRESLAVKILEPAAAEPSIILLREAARLIHALPSHRPTRRLASAAVSAAPGLGSGRVVPLR